MPVLRTPKTYAENRVKVADYGRLSGGSPLTVPVATTPGYPDQVLHVLAAAAFDAMAAACLRDTGIVMLVQSGLRPRRFKDRAAYEAFLIKTYAHKVAKTGDPDADRKAIIAYGQARVAYASPHETGLALDFGCAGVSPTPPRPLAVHSAASIAAARATALHTWLVAHAHEYGFTPYKAEPWHWEYKIPLVAWQTGVMPDTGAA